MVYADTRVVLVVCVYGIARCHYGLYSDTLPCSISLRVSPFAFSNWKLEVISLDGTDLGTRTLSIETDLLPAEAVRIARA